MTGSPAPQRRLLLRRALLASCALLLAWAGWEIATWPDVGRLATENPKTTAFIEAWKAREDARDARTGPSVSWTPVPLARISRQLQLAVLVAEDDRFFTHEGFATEEMKSALKDALEGDKPMRGASTITQQLAKNLWLSPSRNPLRKLREAILTAQLERKLPKKRILELYLNCCEFGPGIYGAEAAARRYFGKSSASLSAGEAAELAASLTRPRTWHPGVTTKGYRARVELIRSRMQRWPWVLP